MTLTSKVLGRTGFSVSSIGLGTAEIGFLYGLKNKELSDEDTAIALLHRAVELGITVFDTGHIYGVSEERLGRSGIAKDPNILITTKCGHVMDKTDDFDPAAISKDMRTEVEESLTRLQIERIPLLQIHGASAHSIQMGFIQDTMRELQKEGKVQYVGISTRGEEAAFAALEDGFFDTLQLAHSIIDQRMVAEIMPLAEEKNVGILNRSVLLKGVLTVNGSDLPEGLSNLRENSDKAREIANEIGIDLPALAIRFALSNPTIDTVLIGSSKVKNIESAVAAAEAGPLSKDILQRLRELAIEEARVVDPSLWKY